MLDAVTTIYVCVKYSLDDHIITVGREIFQLKTCYIESISELDPKCKIFFIYLNVFFWKFCKISTNLMHFYCITISVRSV